MTFKQSYTYDDIGIVPNRFSQVDSRDSVNPSTNFLGFKLSLPIIVAPMRMVVNEHCATEIHKLGGVACLPRGSDPVLTHLPHAIHSIPVSNGIQKFEELYQHQPTAVCIDTANGFNKAVGLLIGAIKRIDPNIKVIAGNIGSVVGYSYLKCMGADAVRVGIGGGSVCTTSVSTGIGVGQASLIREIAEFRRISKENNFPLIIADGGIKSPADMVKAIALGADIVMAGRIFAGSEESPGEVIKFQGKKYKQYAGEASFAVKRSNKYIEGDETLVPYSGPVAATWHKFEDGLRSAMSYMGTTNLEGLNFLPDECFALLTSSASGERNARI